MEWLRKKSRVSSTSDYDKQTKRKGDKSNLSATQNKRAKRPQKPGALKPCRNHYRKGPDACDSELPYCCPRNTASAGSCRRTRAQCKTTGVAGFPDVKSTPRYDWGWRPPPNSVRRPKPIEITRVAQKRNAMKTAPRRVVERLGPFVADTLELYLVYRLGINVDSISGISLPILAQAMDAALLEFDQRNLPDTELERYLAYTYPRHLLQKVQQRQRKLREPQEIHQHREAQRVAAALLEEHEETEETEEVEVYEKVY